MSWINVISLKQEASYPDPPNPYVTLVKITRLLGLNGNGCKSVAEILENVYFFTKAVIYGGSSGVNPSLQNRHLQKVI
jgi:hypothetical protein